MPPSIRPAIAVLHGVLDERLKEKRRHERAFERSRQLLDDGEPGAETDPFDAQVLPHERELLAPA